MLSEICQAQKSKANVTEVESRIVGVPANAMASTVTIRVRPKGTLVQHKLVSGHCFKLQESDPKKFIFDMFKHSTTGGKVSL